MLFRSDEYHAACLSVVCRCVCGYLFRNNGKETSVEHHDLAMSPQVESACVLKFDGQRPVDVLFYLVYLYGEVDRHKCC